MTSSLLACGPGKEGSLEGSIDIVYQFGSMTLYVQDNLLLPVSEVMVKKPIISGFISPQRGSGFFLGT